MSFGSRDINPTTSRRPCDPPPMKAMNSSLTVVPTAVPVINILPCTSDSWRICCLARQSSQHRPLFVWVGEAAETPSWRLCLFASDVGRLVFAILGTGFSFPTQTGQIQLLHAEKIPSSCRNSSDATTPGQETVAGEPLFFFFFYLFQITLRAVTSASDSGVNI